MTHAPDPRCGPAHDPSTTRHLTGPGPDATATSTAPGCASCGSPHASTMDTPEGPARLCPPCATLHGLGCP
jgi:hypothetical protein